MGLVDPLLANGRALQDPGGFDFKSGLVQTLQVRRHAVDHLNRAVEVLEVREHFIVPEAKLLEVALQEVVGADKLARQVRLGVDVLVGGLDAGVQPKMFEIVAVGAMARQFELRIPCF